MALDYYWPLVQAHPDHHAAAVVSDAPPDHRLMARVWQRARWQPHRFFSLWSTSVVSRWARSLTMYGDVEPLLTMLFVTEVRVSALRDWWSRGMMRRE